jgi:hypothetical protein
MSGIKGTIIIGSARSGSHMACDMLYNQCTLDNAINLGEVTALPSDNDYIFCSIVQAQIKNLLAVDTMWTKDYRIVNVRRRDKVAQYISWCVFRAQTKSNMNKHSPEWDDYKEFLPWESTKDDIERFIIEQHLDFAFNFDQILYYEDLVDSGLKTKYKKNIYPVTPEQIVTDYELVKILLEKYSYDNR